MELDEYKSIIQIRRIRPFPEASPARLEKVRRTRSRSVVSKIKNSLWLETAFALVFLILACYVVIFTGNLYLQAFGLIMLSFCVYFVYYLSKLYDQIRKQDEEASSVRISLERLIDIIKRFTALYFQLTMIMIPVILILGFLMGYLNHEITSGFSMPFPLKELGIYFGASLAWMAIMYFFTRWYIKKMYGAHLRALSGQLHELQYEQ